jgi:hypothetical protein
MTPPGSCIASGADGISARFYNEAQKSTRSLAAPQAALGRKAASTA